MNINENVEKIIEYVGGKENIEKVSHCATRLRFNMSDITIVQIDKLKKMSDIIGVNSIGKQVQMIIGGDVVKYYPIAQELIGNTKAP